MNLYNKVIEYVDTSFKGKKPHFERAVYWIEQLIPNATEVHKISAYAHDIERAFREEGEIIPENYLDKEFLKNHQEEGAIIISDFLKKENAPQDTIEKVAHLVGNHEVGGDDEQNALMDADSISFFETNAEMFVNEKAPVEGKKKVKEKLDWMFNRISTEEHKKFARDNYEKWSKELEPLIISGKEKWEKIVTHNDKEIRGFFGEYRFLSNFWPAKVFLDGEEYGYVENAYQAAKYKKELRDKLKTCSPKEAVVFVTENPIGQYTLEEWNNIKLQTMEKLLLQKFDKELNPENYEQLMGTSSKYLEEANYWGDVYWGVSKTDASENVVGKNNLGKLLMKIRDDILKSKSQEEPS